VNERQHRSSGSSPKHKQGPASYIDTGHELRRSPAGPRGGSTAEELLEAADAGLVRAKRAGGNRIAIHIEERMILKSSYYPRPSLHRLTKLARRTGRPEASLLREALDDYLARNQELL
jgi:diguanylate cyclase